SGIRKCMAARDGLKIREAKCHCDRAAKKSRVAQTLPGFLRQQAQSGFQNFAVRSVAAKRTVVRNGFRLRIHEEFIRILPTSLAVERRSPAAKCLFQSLVLDGGKLRDILNAQSRKRACCHFPDAGNFSHAQRRKKTL